MSDNSAGQKILIIIPARGGSKGIPRKNLRILQKKPLLYYSIHNALSSKHHADVIVSSENQEILSLARKMGADIHKRPKKLAEDTTTLDPVIHDAYTWASKKFKKNYDLIVTLQPTSPLLKTSSLDTAIDTMIHEKDIDTLLSATKKVGLSWRREGDKFVPNYSERVNRQQLDPVYYETGGFLICRSNIITPESRIGQKIHLFELSEEEGIDIDTFEEWNLCAYLLSRKKIVLATTGYPSVGLGHIYRTLLLADRIVNHELLFVVDHRSNLGLQKIRETHHKVVVAKKDEFLQTVLSMKPDMVINDRLDTDEEYMGTLNSAAIKTVNFEDLGSGSYMADVVFNALYPPGKEQKDHFYGPRYFCGRQEFLLSHVAEIRPHVKQVLLTFGGTDPNNLTLKTLRSIYSFCQEHQIKIVVIAGLGYENFEDLKTFEDIKVYKNVKNISDHMLQADVAFTSAGRTTYELAMLGIPTIVQAQNKRELTHVFASDQYGFINLGHGVKTTKTDILGALRKMEDYQQRLKMQRIMMATDLRQGIDRVTQIINSTIAML